MIQLLSALEQTGLLPTHATILTEQTDLLDSMLAEQNSLLAEQNSLLNAEQEQVLMSMLLSCPRCACPIADDQFERDATVESLAASSSTNSAPELDSDSASFINCLTPVGSFALCAD